MRPRTRVAFCQEVGRLRSLIGRAGREHLRPPAPLKSLDQRRLVPPTAEQLADGRALYHLEQAVNHLTQAEQVWDDPPEAPE